VPLLSLWECGQWLQVHKLCEACEAEAAARLRRCTDESAALPLLHDTLPMAFEGRAAGRQLCDAAGAAFARWGVGSAGLRAAISSSLDAEGQRLWVDCVTAEIVRAVLHKVANEAI